MRCSSSKSESKIMTFLTVIRDPFPDGIPILLHLKRKQQIPANTICYLTETPSTVQVWEYFTKQMIFWEDDFFPTQPSQSWNHGTQPAHVTRFSTSCRFSTYFWWHRAIGCFTNPSWKLLSWKGRGRKGCYVCREGKPVNLKPTSNWRPMREIVVFFFLRQLDNWIVFSRQRLLGSGVFNHGSWMLHPMFGGDDSILNDVLYLELLSTWVVVIFQWNSQWFAWWVLSGTFGRWSKLSMFWRGWFKHLLVSVIKPPAMHKSHDAVVVDVSAVSPFVLTTYLARSRLLRL